MSLESGKLQHYVKGNIDSKILVVFLQGWPDSLEMWQEKMHTEENFSDYKQLYINFPNYGSQKIAWGQDFPQVVERIKTTIDSVKNIDKKILVCHDWGCQFGYILDKKYPSYFNRIVAMDVPAYTQVQGFLNKLFVVIYQITLIFAFVIGGKVGRFITRCVSLFFKHKPSYFKNIQSDRNYPYFYFWKNIVLAKLGKGQLFLKGYKPSVPINYYYASKKPFQFHGKRWQQYITNNGGTIKGVQSGHWLMSKNRQQLCQQIKDTIKTL